MCHYSIIIIIIITNGIQSLDDTLVLLLAPEEGLDSCSRHCAADKRTHRDDEALHEFFSSFIICCR